jgi:hypothetical protein
MRQTCEPGASRGVAVTGRIGHFLADTHDSRTEQAGWRVNDKVQFPAAAVGGDATDDALNPLQSLLRGLSLLPEAADVTGGNFTWAFSGTPQSVSILEAGGSALSKGWAVVVAGLGGSTAIAAVLSGFWQSQSEPIRTVLLLATAAILVASILAIAHMVVSDIRSRTTGMVAIYDARRAIAHQFLKQAFESSMTAEQAQAHFTADSGMTATSQDLVTMLAAAGSPAIVIHTPTGSECNLCGIRQTNNIISVHIKRTSDGGVMWCPPTDLSVTDFSY